MLCQQPSRLLQLLAFVQDWQGVRSPNPNLQNGIGFR
jgi:hypothetical protein